MVIVFDFILRNKTQAGDTVCKDVEDLALSVPSMEADFSQVTPQVSTEMSVAASDLTDFFENRLELIGDGSLEVNQKCLRGLS